MKRYLALLLSILALTGCASIKFVPEQVSGGTINEKENSQTITSGGVAITARSADSQTLAYNLDEPVSSFFVVVENQTDSELAMDADSFVLVDSERRQYFSLTPDKLKEIVSRNAYYLMPYPYVGFYYLEDYEKSSFYNRFTSDRPYFYEVNPQDIYTKALPAGTIIPKAKVAGLVYFRIDIQDKKGVTLLVYRKGTPKSASADFSFPFKIVK